MKRLSGWARLWVVAAVLMWSGGIWWVLEHPIPRPTLESNVMECVPEGLRSVPPWPPACATREPSVIGETRVMLAPTCAELEAMQARCEEDRAAEYRRDPAAAEARLEAMRQRNRVLSQEHVMNYVARYAFVAVLPIVAWLVFAGLRAVLLWVRRGFAAS